MLKFAKNASMVAIFPLFGAATPGFANDCPDLGLSSSERDAFCREFRELLYAPFDPGSDRTASNRPSADITAIIESDSLWGEIYRSDPKQTIDLITRIRSAGGLDQQ